jgi:hypothetical protein
MKTYARIWSLWPSIEDMARDLDESSVELAQVRDAGDIPAPRHDKNLIARSIFMGKPLSVADFAAHRNRRKVDVIRHDRSRKIHEFYEQAGGADNLARLVKASQNALHICKHRGVLSRSRKFEFMQVAQKIGFELPDELFTPLG